MKPITLAMVLLVTVAAMGVSSGGCRSAAEPVVAESGRATPVTSTAPVASPTSSAGDASFPPEARAAAQHNRAGADPGLEVAVFGGGCFWGMEELLRQAEGVVSTEVGYAGGADENASYPSVSTGATGHAEAVKVVFDPRKTTYEKLVQWFFRIHDPTTPNRQGNDTGSQYRSVIFYQSPEQGRVANEVKARGDRSGKLPGPIVTQVVPAARFTPAEDSHQDYLQKNPGGYSCHFVRPDSF